MSFEQYSEKGPRATAAGDLANDDVIPARLADETEPAGHEPADPPDNGPRRSFRRRIRLPLILFILTCVSTFWVGACQFEPQYYFAWGLQTRQSLLAHWQDGLIYMSCVLAILITHEMGHFLATLWYRIPASFPYCLPLPITPLGTLGAVIGMDGRQADRRQMFDIGLAGPLAGLVVAIPIILIGIARLDLREPGFGSYTLDQPLAVRMALQQERPPGYAEDSTIWWSHLNPFFMAGWVGLLITGLNMLPVSQLDGGHVIYALLGKWAHWIARAFMVLAIAYVVYHLEPTWILMIFLVLLIGTDHPPTRDDTVPLGWFRTALGYASLTIPILCFAPKALMLG